MIGDIPNCRIKTAMPKVTLQCLGRQTVVVKRGGEGLTQFVEQYIAADGMCSARFPTLIYALAAIDSSVKGKPLDDAQRVTVWLSVFAWGDEPGLEEVFAGDVLDIFPFHGLTEGLDSQAVSGESLRRLVLGSLRDVYGGAVGEKSFAETTGGVIAVRVGAESGSAASCNAGALL